MLCLLVLLAASNTLDHCMLTGYRMSTALASNAVSAATAVASAAAAAAGGLCL